MNSRACFRCGASSVVAGQPQRGVGLDRGRQVGRAAVEVGPGAVVALLRADPAGGLLEVDRVEDAEELAQQQVFGVHRDVGARARPSTSRPGPGGRSGAAWARRTVALDVSRSSSTVPVVAARSVRASSPITVHDVAPERNQLGRGARAAIRSASRRVDRPVEPRLGLAPRPRRRRRPPRSASVASSTSSSDVGGPSASSSASRADAGAAGVERGHDRRAALAGPHVRRRRLAGHRRVADDAEHVVDQLEAHAEVVAERAPARRRPRPARRPPARRSTAEQASSDAVLPASIVSTSSTVDVVGALEREIARLAADQQLGRRSAAAAAPRWPAAPSATQRLDRRGQHRGAGQDRLPLAEDDPAGRAVPPLEVAVHDVVVQQREVVHQFDRDRGRHAVVAPSARRPRPTAPRASAGSPCRRRPRSALPSASNQPSW